MVQTVLSSRYLDRQMTMAYNYCLTDHKVATSGKGITKLSALKANGYYQMWATIEPTTG